MTSLQTVQNILHCSRLQSSHGVVLPVQPRHFSPFGFQKV